ncbi:MAG TPA: protease inhibitor I42 family protein [Lysobacter sp.]
MRRPLQTICVSVMRLRQRSGLILVRVVALALVLPLALAACDGRHAAQLAGASGDEHVLGRYVGWLPCADCTAIRADLQLYAVGDPEVPTHYSLRTIRVVPGAEVRAREERGSWNIQPSADRGGDVVYRLDSAVGQQALDLRRLDDGRLRVPGPGRAGVEPVLYRVPGQRQAGLVDIGAGDVAMPVMLEQGQQLRVNLRGSPASGRRWELADADAGLLRMEQDPGPGPMDAGGANTGSGGTHTWLFRAVGKGSAHLRFIYRRDWESPQAAAQVAEFSISVL